MYKRFRMKFKYSYIINDNCVICFARPDMRDPTTVRCENMLCAAYDANLIAFNPNCIPPDNEYKGVAKLKAGDTSDIKQAKEIAKLKAIRAALKAYRNYLYNLIEPIKEFIVDGLNCAMTLEGKIGKIQNEIFEATGKDN